MAAAIPRPDSPGFLPVGTHEVHGQETAIRTDMDLIARIMEAAALVCDTPGQIEQVNKYMC